MTPWNYELFEFNKMLLVYLLTIIILTAWLIKMIFNRKIIFKKTFWDIPLLIFLITQVLATVFSIDRHTSVWGYYSRFNGGLLSTFSYLILYWAFVSNIGKTQLTTGIRCLLASATIVSLYGIAEHFGIDARFWVQDVQNRVFSTLGQPNWLAAWLVALLTIPMAFFLKNQNPLPFKINFKKVRWLNLGLIFILYLCLLYTKSRSGIIGFAIIYLIFWAGIVFFNKEQIKVLIKPFLIVTGLVFVVTFLSGTPWTPSIKDLASKKAKPQAVVQENQIPSGGTESGEIRKIVWKGGLAVWKNHPLFGTGLETFAYSYYWYRPREHNDISEWDFLYNKAHNEYLNFAATTGTAGLLGYLTLIITFLIWGLKKTIKKQNSLNLALLAGFISILITNFFGFSVVVVALLFFLLPAFFVINLSQEKEMIINKNLKLRTWQLLTLTFILISALTLITSVVRYWYADSRLALGEKLNKAGHVNSAFKELQKAVNIRPNEPIYQNQISLVTATLAVVAFKQGNATLSAQLIDTSIKASNQALIISPYNINFWKNRTRIFYKLKEINKDYNNQALTALLQAAKLSPTDAKVQYNLGILYNEIDQQETALKTLQKAVELKPNYTQARYALALFYEERKEIEKAKEQLNYILEKIDPHHESTITRLKILKEIK